MRVLLTGASSFTGCWFATSLAKAGHEIVATFTRGDPSEYADPIRSHRIALVGKVASSVFGCRFGDEAFISTVLRSKPDVLCHHGAEVTNYKSPDFDFRAALDRNTYRIRNVLHALDTVGCRRVVLTGSVFEAGEGCGTDGLPDFSPYGLSKSLTAATISYFCRQANFSLGKFVIPNPFGPWEEPRFTTYLVRCWRAGEIAAVSTPEYVRDNIHVSLLASAYEDFVSKLPTQPGFVKLNPSGYVETQRRFAERFAREIGSRQEWATALEFADQIEFYEPLVRVNCDRLDTTSLNWKETMAWDELADYYDRVVSRTN